MDRLHGLGVNAAATLAADAPRLSFTGVVSFGPRFWWYDVHQVEGAV